MRIEARKPAQPELAENSKHSLAIFLEMALPLLISDYERRGGPLESDRQWCRDQIDFLGSHGDILLYRGTAKDESGSKITSGDVCNRLVKALAIMSFQPGGVTLFGTNYQGEIK